jgi:hypothetical protein
MKRIIATVLAGGLTALTLAVAPARAEERAYDGREGVHEEYDRRPPPQPERRDRQDRYTHERRDEGDRDDGYHRDDGDAHAEQERHAPYRHANVGIGVGDIDVHIDAGNWLAQR